jgi:hypothetical protein
MRARLLVLAIVLGAIGFQLARGSGRAVAPLPKEQQDPLPVAAPPIQTLAVRPQVLARDPFRFADGAPLREKRAHVAAPRAEVPSPTPAPARVRLVGLVRRHGILHAALVVDGTLALASPGDTVGSFRVLSLDDDGVRLRDSEGQEKALVLPEEP